MDNFEQGDIFADIFPPVPAQPTQATQANARPTRQTPPKTTQGKSLPLPEVAPQYRVVRSPRRKRSISAFRKNGVIEIHMPARTSKRDEASLIPEMIAMVLARESKAMRSESQLMELAESLLAQYLPEFHERPVSVSWRSMRNRWGSCTTVDRTIRISDRLAKMPNYVLHSVLLHELIHLRIPDHGKDFYALLDRFPDRKRADAFLSGYELAGYEISPEN